jgi:hypothetical protein
MRLRWNDEAHVFVGELAMPTSKLERDLAEADEREAILAAIRGVAAAGQYVPAAMQGQRTAYNVLAIRPEFPTSLKVDSAAARRRFRDHIEHLRQSRAIVEASIRRTNRHSVLALVVPPEGCADVSHS